MTTKKTTVIAEFRTQGAEKVAKSTDSIGKAQTRLGQASASTGRQFSAQANGLGGLVGAYAAAAANVFAITAAFTALGRAAQAQQTVQGLSTLAAEFGKVGEEVSASINEITKGQLNLAEVAQQANIVISAGLGDQLEGLTEVSLKASRALGRNLTDAFQRVVRGASKLEPELLDELGIFTRIDPAVQKYALETGKAASSLTNFERRQAFANAVVEEGQRKFAAINTTVPTSAEQLEKLAATVTNIGLEIGAFLAGPLGAFASFITNNASAAVIAIGLLFRQVFGRALAAGLESFTGFTKGVSDNLLQLSQRAADTKKSYVVASQGIADSVAKLPPPSRLFGGQAGAEGREVLSRIRAGGQISPAESKKAAAALDELAAAQTRFNKTAPGAAGRAEAQQKALSGLADQVRGLEKQTTLFGRVYTGTFKVMTTVTQTLTVAVSAAAVALNRLFFVVGLIEGAFAIINTIFGTSFSPLAEIGKMIKRLTEDSRAFKGAAGDLAAAFTKDLDTLNLTAEETTEAFEAFGEKATKALTVTFLDSQVNTIKDFFGTIEGTAADSILGFVSKVILVIPTLVAEAIVMIAQKAAEVVDKIPFLDTNFAQQIQDKIDLKQEQAQAQALARQMEGLREASKGVGIEARQAFVQLQAFEKLKIFTDEFGFGIVRAFQRLNTLTGVAVGDFVELSQTGLLRPDSAGNLSLLVEKMDEFGSAGEAVFLQIAGANGELNKFTERADSAIVAAQNSVTKFQDAFARGAANAEKAGQAVVAIRNNIARTEREITQEIVNFGEDQTRSDLERIENQKAAVAALKTQLAAVENLKDELVTLENIQKTVNSQFSAGAKILDQGSATGLFTEQGNLANTQIEQAKARFAFTTGILRNQQAELSALQAGNVELQQITDGEKNRAASLRESLNVTNQELVLLKDAGASQASINALVQERDRIVQRLSRSEDRIAKNQKEIDTTNSRIQIKQAIIRDITNGILGNATKLKDTVAKELLSQERKTKQLKGQLALLQLQNKASDQKRNIDIEFKTRENALELQRNSLSLQQKQQELRNAEFATSQALLKLEKQRSDQQIKALENQSRAAQLQSESNLLGIDAQFDPAIAQEQSNLRDMQAFPNLRSTAQIQEQQKAIIELETQKKLAILEEQKRAAQEEFDLQFQILTAKSLAAVSEFENLQKIETQRQARQAEELRLAAERSAIEQRAIESAVTKATEEKALFEQQRLIADQQAKIQRDGAQAAIEDTRKKAELLKTEATQNKAFIEAQQKLVQDRLVLLNAERELAGFTEKITLDSITTDFQTTIDNADQVLKELTTQENLLDKILKDRLAANKELQADQEKLKQLEIDSLNARAAQTAAIAEIDRQIIEEKGRAAAAESAAAQQAALDKANQFLVDRDNLEKNFENTQEKFRQEEEAIKRTRDERLRALLIEKQTLGDLANAVSGDIQKGFSDVVSTAFDNIASGKNVGEGLTDVLRNTFESVRKSVLEETLIKPGQEFIKEQIGGLFNFGGEDGVQMGADNAEVVGGALKVTEVGNKGTIDAFATEANNAGASFKDTITEGFTSAKEKGNDFFSSLSDGFDGIGSFVQKALGGLSGLFGGGSGGGGGILSSIFGMFSGGGSSAGMPASLNAGNSLLPTEVFSLASGGLVRKFAAGGMQRDRVPAMLEPGEFVVRKPAVQAAGGMGAMQQLNATGQMGGPPVSINVTNEGQPKEAEQQGPPKFDGDKMVVDIVLRDLRTNGPIRRAMRGGEAQ